jgi:8-oxo-dGTP pyrophosphatase MutT (NUDIX family)
VKNASARFRRLDACRLVGYDAGQSKKRECVFFHFAVVCGKPLGLERRDVLMRTLTAEAIELVAAFDAGWNEHVRLSREGTLRLLRESPAPFDRRQFLPGHMTASAIVFSPDRNEVLLVHHHRLHRWLQPGGHIETKDTGLRAAVLREVREETGVAVATEPPPMLAGISVHKIPAAAKEPEHWHHDLLFAMVAASTNHQTSSEAPEVVWCPIDKLSEYKLGGDLIAMIRRSAEAR